MKEEEVEGGWYTEEKMQKELSYSTCLVCNGWLPFISFIGFFQNKWT